MPFTIPNTVDAAFAVQAEPDSRDFDIITAASGQTGVVTGCAVTTTGTTNGSVSVAVGTVRIAGRKIAVATGAVAIAANATGNPRFDLITVDTSGTKAVVAGTAAATPVFPTIPASRVVLAAVYVANGHTVATNLAANTITDKRVIITDAEMENVFWYGATGNARSFVVTTGTSGSGVITSQLATPTGLGTSTATIGGVLAAGTYSYRVAAFNQYGTTVAATAVTRVTTGTASTVTVSWTATVGADGYRIYGRASGSELLLMTVAAPTLSWTDTGGFTPAGALPGANTSGPFTADMVGRSVYISGAGAAGVQYAGSVSVFTSATQVTVTPNLSTTAPSGATAAVGTNDSTAIASAVAALAAGSTLYFPAGQYLSTTGVDIDSKSKISVSGDYATVIATSEADQVIRISNGSQIAVERLRVQHATTTARTDSGFGIHIRFCQDVVIEDCFVFQTCSAGMYLEGVARATVVANSVKDNLADGIHTTLGSTDIDVVGNRLSNTGDDSIAFVSYRVDGNQVARFAATGNAIYQSKARGIGVVGGIQGSIVGNTVNATKAAGIICAQETSFSTYGVSDVTIASNTVIAANTYSTPTLDHGAIHLGCEDVNWPIKNITIHGNHIQGPRRWAISAIGSAEAGIKDIAITNNSYVGPATTTGWPGILLGGLTSVRVAGNRLAYCNLGGIDSYALLGVFQDNEIFYPNQDNLGGIGGLAVLQGVIRVVDNIVINDPGKTAVSPAIYAPVSAAAAANAGTSPPAPAVTNGSIDQSGSLTFGTGTTPAAGVYVTVTFRCAFNYAPQVMLTPLNSATAALNPYVTTVGTTSFQIGLATAAAASQGNTVYAVSWQTVGS